MDENIESPAYKIISVQSAGRPAIRKWDSDG